MADTQTIGTVLRRFLLLGLLVVTFMASAMVTIYALFQTGEVRVPNVVGMSQQDAEHAITRAGLQFKLRRQHFDADAADGSVTDQDPIAGFPVKVGFDIKVDVSKGVDPTGRSDEPAPPGPTNPVDGPAENTNVNRNRNRNRNTNANANGNGNTSTSANANSNKPKPENKNESKGVKTDEPGAVKPKAVDTEAAPPKPKPKPPVQVPPHD